jgi:hypothetical protein
MTDTTFVPPTMGQVIGMCYNSESWTWWLGDQQLAIIIILVDAGFKILGAKGSFASRQNLVMLHLSLNMETDSVTQYANGLKWLRRYFLELSLIFWMF